MYEELTELETEIVKAIDKVRAKKDIPVAVVVAVLETVKGITLDNAIRPAESYAGKPLPDNPVPVQAPPDDEGPAMTIVEKNLDTG